MGEFNIIFCLQDIGGWFPGLMKLFTTMGYASAYVVFISFIYWCLRPGLGLRLALMVPFTGVINAELKLFFHQPRPYWVSTAVSAYGAHKGFGMPSGHAQTAAVMWLGLAAGMRRAWVWALCIAVMLLVGLSRIALGVHFPSQVLLGWGIGIIIVYFFYRLERPFMMLVNAHPVALAAAAVLVTALLLGLGLWARHLLDGWAVPQLWQQNAIAATGPKGIIEPLRLKNIFAHSGVFLGVALGGIFMFTRGWFRPAGGWGRRLMAFVLGVAGAGALQWLGGWLYGVLGRECAAGWAGVFVLGTCTGFWMAGAAPLLFLRLGLAGPDIAD